MILVSDFVADDGFIEIGTQYSMPELSTTT